MAAPAPVTWASDNIGWPIYAEADATGHQERLQINATGDVVDAAGNVYTVNADGSPMDGPGATANEIPQPNIAIRQRQWMMDQAAMAAATHAAAVAAAIPPTDYPTSGHRSTSPRNDTSSSFCTQSRTSVYDYSYRLHKF